MNDVKILKLKEYDHTLSANVVDSKYEDQGFVEILFEIKPFVMKKWTIFQKDRSKTEVFFNNLLLDNRLSPKLFDIESEDPRLIPFDVN